MRKYGCIVPTGVLLNNCHLSNYGESVTCAFFHLYTTKQQRPFQCRYPGWPGLTILALICSRRFFWLYASFLLKPYRSNPSKPNPSLGTLHTIFFCILYAVWEKKRNTFDKTNKNNLSLWIECGFKE